MMTQFPQATPRVAAAAKSPRTRRTRLPVRRLALTFGWAAALAAGLSDASPLPEIKDMTQLQTTAPAASATLSARQQAIVPIAAFAAAGDMPKLNAALNQGLDTDMTVSDAREILVQLYAYAGFPRSLNALGELMRVLDARRQRGIEDAPGRAPGRPIPQGEALLAAGTANQTRLAGGPVEGPLFEFAPTANLYLRTHLFGDIFERDNLDWQSRELATVGMLAALPGVDAQLQSHMRISMNVGLTASQLRQLVEVLGERVDAAAAGRARAALDRHLAASTVKSGQASPARAVPGTPGAAS